jgi:predicted N-formylglutamate amidohydrolase
MVRIVMQQEPVFAWSRGNPILAPDEPPPVVINRPGAPSPFLLIGDHAGNRVPRLYGDLGIDAVELRRHIAWDIGIAALGEALAERIDATFIHQTYSRLVIDCNRRPGAPDSIPPVSDCTMVPANAAVSEAEAAARAEAIHAPYQAAIAQDIARREAAGQETILIALHSFTPRMRGIDRPWQVGILHDAGDSRFARAMIAAFAADPALTVGDNEPYSMDIIDFTIPTHAYPQQLPYAEIEIRQDLLAKEAGIAEWCDRVEQALIAARVNYPAQ